MKGAQTMPTDFSDYTGLIPVGTIALVQAHVRAGDGTDGILKKTKAGDAEGLDFEFTILEGPFAKQKLFWFALVNGETDGQKSMAERVLAKLKGLIDSGFFLDPNDRSPEARKKRSLNWRDFDGIRALVEIGIEEGKGGYPDKNVIVRAITRDMTAWGQRPPIDQVAVVYPGGNGSAPSNPAASAASPSAGANVTPIARPNWAS
jgi:hypothetical protein